MNLFSRFVCDRLYRKNLADWTCRIFDRIQYRLGFSDGGVNGNDDSHCPAFLVFQKLFIGGLTAGATKG